MVISKDNETKHAHNGGISEDAMHCLRQRRSKKSSSHSLVMILKNQAWAHFTVGKYMICDK